MKTVEPEEVRGDSGMQDALGRLAAARALPRWWRAGDERRLDEALSALFANDPARHLEQALPDVLAVLCDAFEALDDFLHDCVLGPDADVRTWRQLFVPGEYGLPLPQLLMNAYWLRQAGSARVCSGAELLDPEDLAGLSEDHRALSLARFCLRHDAGTPLDLLALGPVLDEDLRGMLETWLFRVYLMSPLSFLDEQVDANRRVVVHDYARATEGWAPRRWDPLVSVVLYRSCYVSQSERDFVEAALGRSAASDPTRALEPTERIGLIASHWTAGEPVHRCLAPLVAGIRAPALECFPLDRDPQRHRFAPGWRDGDVSVRPTPAAGERPSLAEHARHLASRELDFLFYPELGLDPTARFLGTQRLARVQAMGYGHPATSGSRAIDYLVGGALVEADARRSTERLVLLPGLGVSSTPPPPPRVERKRPLDDERVLIVNSSSFDKLNPELLEAFGAVLFEAPGARLEMYPGWGRARGLREAPVLARHLPSERLHVGPRVPRQALVDRLVEADLYLDSYPFGGFNTLVEVLCAGVPFVTFEGRLARNRFGAALLRMLDMPEELIARTWPAYVQAASRLARDPGWRRELRAQLGRERVLRALADQRADAHFAAAVEWMRAEGPRDGRPAPPVLIEAGEAPRVFADLPLW